MTIVDVLVDEKWTYLYHLIMMVNVVRFLTQSIPGKTGVLI